LTQSAVSKQIQELEKWVGVPLFERERKRLSLTPAGGYERRARPAGQLEAATLEPSPAMTAEARCTCHRCRLSRPSG
jgi:DNA-binding transcriptional LysR family regulator